jgi:hypothetical protein
MLQCSCAMTIKAAETITATDFLYKKIGIYLRECLWGLFEGICSAIADSFAGANYRYDNAETIMNPPNYDADRS